MSTHSGFTIWFTGMSGAGKSTLAHAVAAALRERQRHVEILDGDEVRENLSKGLSFSKEDRDTNIRRIAYVARLVSRSGGIAISAAISPYRAIREEARTLIGAFVEVYARCPLDALVRRDPKGLYAKALRGEIANFTGVSDPYEEPLSPEIVVETDVESIEESTGKILDALEALGYLAPANGQIAPHGGRLIDRLATPAETAAVRDRLLTLPRLPLGRRALSDLDLIAVGAFSPLDGFLNQIDYDSVVERMRLSNGLPWSMPITLSATPHQAAALQADSEVALTDADGAVHAVLNLEQIYERDLEREAELVYGTSDAAHPGVAAIRQEGTILLGGPVTILRRNGLDAAFRRYALDPCDTRRVFAERDWHTVVGFQSRTPVSRAEEYLQKCALEVADGLLLHPLVGEAEDDERSSEVRMRCYRVLLDGYYPLGRVVLSVLAAAMRYAGPREAVFHALVRKNYGCTHFMVGPDHAGVGTSYRSYDAQRLFAKFSPAELSIQPLFFEDAFYCKTCGAMASNKTCPHASNDRSPPPAFSRPEVASVLGEAEGF